MKKSLSVISLFLCLSVFLTSFSWSASARERIDYTITNPYANVDWSQVKQYKTALHTHTNASDGDITLKESIETHYLQGFDIVATTDHGTNNKSWVRAEDSNYHLIHGLLAAAGRTEGDLVYLGNSGTFDNSGKAYTLERRANGDDYLTVNETVASKTILRLPNGIENNAVSVNAHVNSWFCDYQDNGIRDYVDTMKGVTKAGGICVINHPGEYTKAKGDLTDKEAYDENNLIYRYYINKFYGMIEQYPACVGIDINSKGDSRTRYDRKLWDIMLMRRTPSGKNIFAIASSDAHQASVVNTGYTRLLMTELNSAQARKALENGTSFACSYCNGNQKDLESILESLEKYYGTQGELYAKVKQTVEAMRARVAAVANGTEKKKSSAADPLRLVDENGYFHGKDTYITSVTADNTADTITVKTENTKLVRWIADGEVIAVMKADGGSCTLNLNDYADKLGCYVRAEAFGEGGFIYTQPLVLKYAGAPQAQEYRWFNIPVFDAFFADLRSLFTVMAR
ncbi:MAG TPA: hypothetical protein DDY98_01275 [Ruminococcaceae bacterium]|nr:hypothetical protein [Oscillospiraceae bacterium]